MCCETGGAKSFVRRVGELMAIREPDGMIRTLSGFNSIAQMAVISLSGVLS